MGRTIVQEYGPIYGEPVNGTVQGRPNGSVYVPITNTCELVFDTDGIVITYHSMQPTWLVVCADDQDYDIPDSKKPTGIAQSQDLSSNLQIQVFSDSDLHTMIAYRDFPAGLFNGFVANIYNATPNAFNDEDTLYVRYQLMNNNVPVATSNVVEVTGRIFE